MKPIYSQALCLNCSTRFNPPKPYYYTCSMRCWVAYKDRRKVNDLRKKQVDST